MRERRNRRELAVPDWVLEEHVTEPAREHPLTDRVRDVIEALDEEDRDIVFAFFYERLTYAEVAERVDLQGRSSGFYRVHAVLDRVRQALADAGIDAAAVFAAAIPEEEE